jgi:hypothetical protein
VGHLCRSLKEVSGFASGQEVNVLLERNGRFSEAVPCCFTGLVSDGEDGSSMSHLVDIDGFPGDGECGAGETRKEFNQFHPDALGKGVFTVYLIEDGLQGVFRSVVHLDFSFVEKDVVSRELFFSISRSG